MKAASNELFQLIKSLTTQEKVYFKAFSVHKGVRSQSAGYLQLFNVLDKMKAFDKLVLRSNLKKVGFNQRIKESKRRLTEAILKSLTDYHSDMNKDVILQEMIHRIHILFQKKLFDSALKLLVKAKKIATDYDCYEQLHILSSLEESILKGKSDIKALQNFIKMESRKRITYLELLKNIDEYKNLELIIEPLFRAHNYKNNIDKIGKLTRHPLLQNSGSALTNTSLDFYYFIKLHCSWLLNNMSERNYQEQNDWIKLLEKNRSKPQFSKTNYIRAIGHMIIIIQNIRKIKNLDLFFRKGLICFHSLFHKEKTNRSLSIFAMMVNNYISTQLLVPHPDKVLNAWDELKRANAYNGLNPYLQIIFQANLLIAHFLLNQYNKALDFVNSINNSKNDNRVDIQHQAKLWLLMINYELKKHELLPYIVKSAKNYLVKNNIAISQFDKCVLNYFERKLPEINNKQVEKAVFIW
ncbi:MAG: hypothetical protein HYU69_10005 [Bacteroidetes bacterium]|nr:hypothetical protein [Bacteroidota bacterium]